MPLTLTARSATFIGVAAIALAAAYSLGSTHDIRPAAAATPSPAPGSAATAGITVTGLGRVARPPDVLRLDLGVDVRRDSVDSALAAANASLDRVRDSLRGHGVAGRDLKSSGLSIEPSYRYDNTGPHLQGYAVSESLTAKLRDLGKAGAAISAAAQAGGNDVRINGIALDLEGDSGLVKDARDAAFADAKAKAEQYAAASGRSLGTVTSISEQVSSPPPVRYGSFSPDAARAAVAAVPIEPGSQDVSVSVTVVWSMR